MQVYSVLAAYVGPDAQRAMHLHVVRAMDVAAAEDMVVRDASAGWRATIVAVFPAPERLYTRTLKILKKEAPGAIFCTNMGTAI